MKRSFRLLVLAALLFACLLLGGCGNGREIEEYLFPIMLGLDAAGENQLQITVKALSGNAGASGSEDAQEMGGDTGYITLSATGHDYVQALSLLRATIPRTLNLSQMREVVISETLARSQAMAPLLSDIQRYDRANGNATLVVCAGRAQEVLEKQQAYVGTRISRYLEILLSQYQEKGTIPYATLLSASRAFSGDTMAPLAVYVAINEFDARLPVSEENTLGMLPGHLDRESPNPVEYMGSAVFSAGRMTGTLTGAQTQMLRMLTGDFTTLQYSVDGVEYVLRRLWPAHRSVRTRPSGESLCAQLWLSAQALDGTPVADPDALAQGLAQDARALLSLLQALGADAAGFGRTQLWRHLTLASWAASGWPDRYANCDIEVEIRLFPPT